MLLLFIVVSCIDTKKQVHMYEVIIYEMFKAWIQDQQSSRLIKIMSLNVIDQLLNIHHVNINAFFSEPTTKCFEIRRG